MPCKIWLTHYLNYLLDERWNRIRWRRTMESPYTPHHQAYVANVTGRPKAKPILRKKSVADCSDLHLGAGRPSHSGAPQWRRHAQSFLFGNYGRMQAANRRANLAATIHNRPRALLLSKRKFGEAGVNPIRHGWGGLIKI